MKEITEQDYRDVAGELGVDVAAIKAVAEVESMGAGFLSSGHPKILFEGKWFHRLTDGRFDDAHPDLSYPKWTNKYYKRGDEEVERLNRAAELDREAALQAASWGKFQIMGFHYERLGFDTVGDFVAAMKKKEAEHLKAFGKFIASKRELHGALKNRDWDTFAFRYNGKRYKENKYDTKLAKAYKKYCQ